MRAENRLERHQSFGSGTIVQIAQQFPVMEAAGFGVLQRLCFIPWWGDVRYMLDEGQIEVCVEIGVEIHQLWNATGESVHVVPGLGPSG